MAFALLHGQTVVLYIHDIVEVVANHRASISASTRLPTAASSSDAVRLIGGVGVAQFDAWGLHSIWE